MRRGKAGLFGEVSRARASAHGDDFVVAGPKKGGERVKNKMKEWHDVKVRAVLGRDAGDNKEIVIPGRMVHGGMAPTDADERHRGILRDEMGILLGSTRVLAPTVRTENDEGESDEKLSGGRQG